MVDQPLNVTAILKSLLLSVPVVCSLNVNAGDSPYEMTSEDMFDDNSEFIVEDVNEGVLNFIKPLSNKPVLHSETVLTVLDSSLEDGWVDMQQCYRYLDSISKTDIVYRYKNIRHLMIISISDIGKARLNGQIIDLEDVGLSAQLCVQASVQIFDKLDDQSFIIKNGPYHRKFFDGYYPYHVTLSIEYPEDTLLFSNISPQPQTSFEVINQQGKIYIDTWFEGDLLITIQFKRVES